MKALLLVAVTKFFESFLQTDFDNWLFSTICQLFVRSTDRKSENGLLYHGMRKKSRISLPVFFSTCQKSFWYGRYPKVFENWA